MWEAIKSRREARRNIAMEGRQCDKKEEEENGEEKMQKEEKTHEREEGEEA